MTWTLEIVGCSGNVVTAALVADQPTPSSTSHDLTTTQTYSVSFSSSITGCPIAYSLLQDGATPDSPTFSIDTSTGTVTVTTSTADIETYTTDVVLRVTGTSPDSGSSDLYEITLSFVNICADTSALTAAVWASAAETF